MRVVVIGAGITGLTLGYRLSRRLHAAGRDAEVLVLEADASPGGHASTLREDGYLIEAGPNGFLDRPHEPQTRALVAELALGPRLREARPAARRRFVRVGGRLRRVPDGPPSLLLSDVLSPRGKLRLLLEPFRGPAPPGIEESVYEFAARRIGREAAENLVDAAVSGVSAGDSRELSAEAAFPVMVEMEREHGSLVKAMIARGRGPASRLLGFEGGMATLTGALAERLGDALRTSAAVEHLARAGDGWRVRLAGGETIAADRVALAIAAHRAADLLRGLDPVLAAALERIPFAGLAVVALAYRERDLPRPLDGYGYLVARGEDLDTLGVVWESCLFEGRAPAGHVLLRCMLGGVRRPWVAGLPEADVLARARLELARAMGLSAEPVRAWVRRWPRAIAQYTRGHRERVAMIRELAGRHEGLVLAGTSYDGVSFTSAVSSAERAAERTLRDLQVSSLPAAGRAVAPDTPTPARA